MATRAVRTALHVTRDREYRQKLKGAENALQSLSGGARGAASGLASMGPHAAVAVAGVAAVAASATVAAAAVRTATQAVIALGQRGGEISPLAASFEQLASPELLGRIQDLTGNLVTNQDIMARTNQVLRTGIMTQDQWAEALEATVRAAQDLRVPVEQAMTAVATFASGGGMEGLARIGVDVLQIRERLQQMGLTAETTRGRMVAMDLALAQLGDDLGEIDNSSANVGDSWQQITVAIQNAYDQISLAFAENQRLIQTFDAIAEALRQASTDGDSWGDAIADAVVDVTEALIAAVPAAISLTRAVLQTTEALLGIGEAIQSVMTLGLIPLGRYILGVESASSRTRSALSQMDDALGTLGGVARDVNARFQTLTQSISDMRGEVDRTAPALGEAAGIARGTLAPGMDAARASVGELRLEAARASGSLIDIGDAAEESAGRTEAAAQRMADALSIVIAEEQARAVQNAKAAEQPETRRGGGRSGPSREDLLQEAAMTAGQERKQFEIDQAEEIREVVEETYREQLDAQRRVITELDEQAERERAIHEARMQAGRERKEFEIEAREEEDEQRKNQIRLEEELQAAQMNRIGSAIDNTRKMASAVKGSMGAVISAMEATGASTETTKKAYGILMVAYNSVMAATDLADMARAIAGQDYFAAAAYGLAMAGHIAAAVQAGAELGGGSAKTPAQGTFTPSQRSEPEDREPEGRGTVINNNYGFGQGNSEIGEAVTNHVQRYQRVDGVRHEAPAFYG